MEYIVGFLIAALVGLTGVGAGALTAPILILFLGMAPAESVGTALIFGAVTKILVVPIYVARKQVNLRIFLLLCAGGLPGVLAGSLLLERLDVKKQQSLLFLVLGGTVLVTALYSLYRATRGSGVVVKRDRSGVLPLLAAGIGAEVGFSSAGAGALGSLALLCLTPLTPVQVVGTDLSFGLVLSIIGGGLHILSGHYGAAVLVKLILGGLFGAFAGANLAAILPSKPFRIVLSVCLVTLGGQLCWRALT
jgi:uncharacterized membrane protein YfcA